LGADYHLLALAGLAIATIIIALGLSNMPVSIFFSLCTFFLGVSAYYILNNLLRCLPGSIVSVSFVASSSSFQLRKNSGGENLQAELHSCVIWPWLIFLNLRVEKHVIQLLLTPTHIGRNDFRRLLVLLRSVKTV